MSQHFTENINDMDMHFEVLGEGEPLFFLHGFLNAGVLWEQVKGIYAKDFLVVIPDLRGHGKSNNPSGITSHRQSALDIHALIDHLGFDRINGLGYSSGAATLLHMAANKPDSIDTMVLTAPPEDFFETDEARHQAFLKRLQEQKEALGQPKEPEISLGNMEEFFIRTFGGTKEKWRNRRTWHKGGDEQILALLNPNQLPLEIDDIGFTPSRLATISAKSLIVHGDRDPQVPVDRSFAFYKAIPDAYLCVVPNGFHVPSFGPIKDTFVETTLSFLKRSWN